jgi:hypothetical protein
MKPVIGFAFPLDSPDQPAVFIILSHAEPMAFLGYRHARPTGGVSGRFARIEHPGTRKAGMISRHGQAASQPGD